MTPSALRSYLRERGQASLPDLTAHFGVGVGLIEDLLAYWQRKGKILQNTAVCGKACVQNCGQVVFYRWQE
ncbi:MAG: FeoC-like transcriptional regulator [Zoogloeaceae bacterium]|jgi:hypothetical protein|nr:FeoC-like transcriptional regulator [Zoogloeaceae bacterium]